MRTQYTLVFLTIVVSIAILLSGCLGGTRATADGSAVVPESGSTAIPKQTQPKAHDGSIEDLISGAATRSKSSDRPP